MKIEKEIFPAGTDSRFFREVGIQLSIIYQWYILVATVLKYFFASSFFAFQTYAPCFLLAFCSRCAIRLSRSFILLIHLLILSYCFDSDSGSSSLMELRSFRPMVRSLQSNGRPLHNKSYFAPCTKSVTYGVNFLLYVVDEGLIVRPSLC